MSDAATLHDAIDQHVIGNSGWRHIERDRLHKIATKLAGLEAQAARLQDANEALGFWMSAALDDDDVCEDMKRDIRAWFDAQRDV